MTLVDSVVAPVAPAPTSRHATDLGALDALARVHRQLRHRRDLRPCAEVDRLFGELVRLVVSVPPGQPAPVDGGRRRDLQRLCAEGEYHLEADWAGRIAASADPVRTLAGFPYLANYRRLVRMEVDTLARTIRRRARRLAFLGSGSLPLSPLLLAEALGASVDAVDADPAALDAGRRVAAALGADHAGCGHASGRVRFVEADAAHLDVGSHDVVVLAALVGDTAAAKRAVLTHLGASMAPGAVLLARSARAARTLLYPPVEAGDLQGFDLQTVIHPVDDVVNSVVVARVPTPPADGGR